MTSYKKHDVFNGFLVPSNGRIKKFIVLDTGLKFNITHNKTIIDYITSEVGFNNSFPLFSLVLIKENEDPLDIGTLSLYFDYKKVKVKLKRNKVLNLILILKKKIYVLLEQKI